MTCAFTLPTSTLTGRAAVPTASGWWARKASPHQTGGLRRTLSIREQEGNIKPRGYYRVGATLSGRLIPRALICSQAVSGCAHQLKTACSKPERDAKLCRRSSLPLEWRPIRTSILGSKCTCPYSSPENSRTKVLHGCGCSRTHCRGEGGVETTPIGRKGKCLGPKDGTASLRAIFVCLPSQRTKCTPFLRHRLEPGPMLPRPRRRLANERNTHATIGHTADTTTTVHRNAITTTKSEKQTDPARQGRPLRMHTSKHTQRLASRGRAIEGHS